MTALTFVIGCTGSGKAALGVELARRTGGEIISLDSMKVYRRMDVGTAKPSAAVRAEVPFHLIDIIEPSEDFSVAQFVSAAEQAIADINRRGKRIFVVGGTPLFLKALTEGLFEGPGADPEIRLRLQQEARDSGSGALHGRLAVVDPPAAQRIHPNDLRRIVRALEVHELTGRSISELQTQWDRERTRFECTLFGMRRDLADQNHRTNERVRRMLDAGLVDEVRGLLAEPRPLSQSARQALGYAEIIAHLEGAHDLAEAVERIKINTRQFAKAQRTWFRRFREVQWIDLQPDSKVDAVADEVMRRLRV